MVKGRQDPRGDDGGRAGHGPAGLDALLGRTASLSAAPRTVQELSGGLTNRNFKVTTPDGSFVARICADARLLGIDRDNEHHNSVAAAAAGVGAPVVEYRPQDCLLVLRFIEGHTFSSEDVADPANIPRIARSCRLLHGGQRFAADFNMFEVQRRYYATVRAGGFRLPAGYDDLMPQFEAARRALAARDEGTVPCNNDLLAGNFIDDGARLWLIDYEYSGNNDPCFELGNIASESGLSAAARAALVTAYYGRALRSKIARAELLGLVAKYGWTLWGSIQAATSPLDFDFWSWAMERYEPAAAGLTGRGFGRLLDDVQRDD